MRLSGFGGLYRMWRGAQPALRGRVRFRTRTLQVPHRALRSRLTISANRDTELAVCQATLSNSRSVPARAQAVPANCRASLSDSHAGPSNLHAISAFCVCGSSDPAVPLSGTAWALAGTEREFERVAWQSGRARPAERSLVSQSRSSVSRSTVILWQQ